MDTHRILEVQFLPCTRPQLPNTTSTTTPPMTAYFATAILLSSLACSSAWAQTGTDQHAELARDLGRAAARLERAAQAFDPDSSEHGEIHYWADAFRQMEQDPSLIDNGTGKGFYRLGQFFEAEEGPGGLAPDPDEAIQWYRRAATWHDHSQAQLKLGLIHLGKIKHDLANSATNYSEAARWLRKAAEHDHPTAQTLLAVMHLEGLGVRQSETDADTWLERANQNGYAVTKDALLESLRAIPFSDWNFSEWGVW